MLCAEVGCEALFVRTSIRVLVGHWNMRSAPQFVGVSTRQQEVSTRMVPNFAERKHKTHRDLCDALECEEVSIV